MASPPPSIPLEYLVLLDLEAYCDNPTDPHGPEIVELPFLVYDLTTRTVVDHKQIYITPRWSANPNPPPDVVQAFGVDVAFSPSLADALAQFDAYVYHSFFASHKSFCLLTDGHWDVTHYLYFEAARKAIPLNAYFRIFFDLRAEFCKCYPTAPHPHNRTAMFDFLNIPPPPRGSGVDECIGLAALITRLLRDGHRFTQPEVVTDAEWSSVAARVPAVATPVAAAAPVGAVIRLRGLPWASSERDVEKFLAGIPIVPHGIHFVLNAQGKATGEAFVQLETVEAVSAALARHKRSVGRRYIEVFKSSPVDMANHLGRADARRQLYAGAAAVPSRNRSSIIRTRGPRQSKDNSLRYVVKVSGLPPDASHDDVALLMEGVQIAGEGLIVVKNSDGLCSGDAFVEVASEAHVKKAVSRAGTRLPITRMGESEATRYVTVDVRKSSLTHLRAVAFGADGGGGSGGGNGGSMGERDRGRRLSLVGNNGGGNGAVTAITSESITVSDHASDIRLGNGNESDSGKDSIIDSSDKFVVTVRQVSDTARVDDIMELLRGVQISENDVHFQSAQSTEGAERVARIVLHSREDRDIVLGRTGYSFCGREAIFEDGSVGSATPSEPSFHSTGIAGAPLMRSSRADVSPGPPSTLPLDPIMNSPGAGPRIVRMRGLPFAADDEDIKRFFAGFRIADGGIVRGRDRHGRASGEACVKFASEDEARAAVHKLDKAHMGNRYIELKL